MVVFVHIDSICGMLTKLFCVECGHGLDVEIDRCLIFHDQVVLCHMCHLIVDGEPEQFNTEQI